MSDVEQPDARPVDYLRGSSPNEERPTESTSALIVLNQPIASVKILNRLWEHSKYHICADGGANQLHDLLRDSKTSDRKSYLPDIIHGDLDSLRDDVKAYYKQHDVAITLDPDQYSTDFGKSIKWAFKTNPDIEDILVLGTIAGRVDQGIGLLSEMYREQISRPGTRFWLFSESSISFILLRGKTVIHTPLGSGLITKNVGILPVYGPASITTEGLEWDVEDWPTKMGGQVSSSNHIVRDTVTITTDMDVLFTVERATRNAG